jgi:hypothetical protein
VRPLRGFRVRENLIQLFELGHKLPASVFRLPLLQAASRTNFFTDLGVAPLAGRSLEKVTNSRPFFLARIGTRLRIFVSSSRRLN